MKRRRALGVYREPQFSPGKVEADAAVLNAVLTELSAHGVDTSAVDAEIFAKGYGPQVEIILAMCQGERALTRLADAEAHGIVSLNSALAIRNCYRDLLGPGLIRAGVPTPSGALVSTLPPIDLDTLAGLDLSAGVYVKRGDLHALCPEDVQRVEGRSNLVATLQAFGQRGIRSAFVQQAVEGRTLKFYGVTGGEFFTAIAEDGAVSSEVARALARAGELAASVLGLDAWGGDAVLSGGRFAIIDFNDWPSYSRVCGDAARAIARRAMRLLGLPL